MFDLIICDVDGCLCPERSEPLDVARLAEVADYNRAAFEQGDRPPLTLCTGRPEGFAEAICRLVQNPRIPCVAENGVWLFYPEKNGYERDPNITADDLQAVHEASLLLDREYSSLGVTQQPGKTASVSLYHDDPQVLQEISSRVQAMLNARGWPFRVSMTWNYINCDLTKISKASGVERLCAAVGAQPGNCLGIGDSMNDLPVAELVGKFCAPANATEEIQALADFISPHPETAGVIDILNRVVNKDWD